MQQPAFDVAVVQVVDLDGAQTHSFPELRVAGKDNGFPAAEMGLETLTHDSVKGTQVFLFPQTLPVRRIEHDQPFTVPDSRRPCEGTDIPTLDMHPSCQPGSLNVSQSCSDSGPVGIVTQDDREAVNALLHAKTGLDLEIGPYSADVILPHQKAVGGSEYPRCDIPGHEGRFQGQRAGTAHGIDKGAAFSRKAGPSRSQKDGRRQVLLQGSLPFFVAVAPFVEGFTGKVQADGTRLSGKVKVEPYAGLPDVYRRPLTGKVPEPVHHRILYLEGRKVGVVHRAGLAAGVNGESGVRGKMLFPGDLPDPAVKIFLGPDRKAV